MFSLVRDSLSKQISLDSQDFNLVRRGKIVEIICDSLLERDFKEIQTRFEFCR